jgi:hypothetical protein
MPTACHCTLVLNFYEGKSSADNLVLAADANHALYTGPLTPGAGFDVCHRAYQDHECSCRNRVTSLPPASVSSKASEVQEVSSS